MFPFSKELISVSVWLHYSGRLYWILLALIIIKSFKDFSDMQAGARGAGLLSNPNKPSSDWLKMEVGTLERGWGIVLTPPLPVLAGSSHTPQRTQTWRTASPGWLCLRTSTSLSLPKVSLCFWICRRADIIAAVSFYILLFKFLYCIWGLKRWAWFLIKPISKWRAFWVLVASSLRKIFPTWPNPGSSRAFGNNVPHVSFI